MSSAAPLADHPPAIAAGQVSVVIPAYNAAATIEATIRSALAQTRPALEILVIDDGSADDTAARVAGFGDPVRLVRKPNGGPASARNMGASMARGEWLAMLDADDIWFPDKTERQLALADAPEIGIVHVLAMHSRARVPTEIAFADLWRTNFLLNSAVLIRRRAFDAVGGLDEDRALISVEDYNLWLRVAAAGWRIVTCQAVVLAYTRGQGLSSHADRFLAASLANVESAGRRLNLPEAAIRAKRRDVIGEFGRNALFERRLPKARALFRRSFQTAPSLPGASRLAASYLPAPVLDARRSVSAAVSRHAPTAPDTLFGSKVKPAELGRLGPFLLVVIDTEEEFDWSQVPTNAHGVDSMAAQGTAQRLFEPYGLIPTYAVDYAVGSQRNGYAPLLEFLADGRCEVGAQLHPWLNPPVSEPLSVRNTFPGNLPPSLEAAKIRVLTKVIEDNLGVKPLLYRAGRYGLGPATAEALSACGYLVDCSVRPRFGGSRDGGPDFRHAPAKPFWFGPDGTLLEVPVTVGMVGGLSRAGRHVYPLLATAAGQRMRLPGALARAGLINRVQLSPEGSSLAEAKRLTEVMLHRDAQQVFVLSYHSPSLVPGNTPYVRSEQDLRVFLHWIEAYLDFFFGQLGGCASTPVALYQLAKRLGDATP